MVRVNWDGTKVTDNEVHDYLPTLVRSAAVEPCLLVLDDIWSSKQVPRTPSSLSRCRRKTRIYLYRRLQCPLPAPLRTYTAAQVKETVDIVRKGGKKVRVLVTTRDEQILKQLKFSVQVIVYDDEFTREK